MGAVYVELKSVSFMAFYKLVLCYTLAFISTSVVCSVIMSHVNI